MQNPFKGSFQIDFYSNQAKIKWFVLAVAIVIGGGSIIYTNNLVEKLKAGEREKIRVWAAAVEFISTPGADNSALTFISENIITPDNTLPVIVVDSATNEIRGIRNVDSTRVSLERILSQGLGQPYTRGNDEDRPRLLNGQHQRSLAPALERLLVRL